MTPAINLAKKLKIAHTVHEYVHDPNSDSYGLEAADKLQVAPERVFKTLVVAVDNGELVVAVVPVSSMLSMKQIARAAGGKKPLWPRKRTPSARPVMCSAELVPWVNARN
jgi:Cys-tRNA(Pro)/Cys-tRNA(Cys) deacylase